MPPVMRRMAFAPPPSPDLPPQDLPPPDVMQQENYQVFPPQIRRMAHNPPADLTTSTSILSTQQTPSLPPKNPRHKRNMRAQDTSDVPRSQPYNPPRQKIDIPEKFVTRTKEETIAPMSTLEVDVAATTSQTTTATTRITHSKMNDLHIPSLPIWFPYILAILILSGFVLAGVLACATFPQEVRRFCRGLTSALWRRMGRRGRGRYHSIAEDADSDSDGLENVETSAKSSSSPELEMGRMRKRNHKNLRVKTKGIAYSGLGIGVRGRGSAGSSDADAGGGGSAVGSAVSEVVASARELLFGDRVGDSKKSDDGNSSGFLGNFASHIDSAAEWWARLLHTKVRGAEEGLLFRVEDCEREGFVGRDGVRVGVGRREAW